MTDSAIRAPLLAASAPSGLLPGALSPAALALEWPAPRGVAQRPAWLARTRIALTYRWRHGRWPQIDRPRRFTEWVQWRKLHDRDPRQSRLQDKVAVKHWVASLLGTDWVTPTLWHGTDLPEQPPCPAPYVVKSRHGCNQRLFVRQGDSADWSAIRRTAARWLDGAYGYWLDEWLYRAIPRGLLIEPFIGNGQDLPVDYKVYVFGGRAAAVQVHLDREHAHRWLLFDRNWTLLSRVGPAAADQPTPSAPPSLDRIMAAAERLGQGFDFVRVDFYDIDGAPRFGEMTFYPGSGLDPFESDAVDLWLGSLWAEAAVDYGFGLRGINCPASG